MEYERTFVAEFDAGVGKAGHHYRVEATTGVRFDPKTGDTTDAALQERLAEVVAELDNRSLDDMLPAVPRTTAGIATYFMERLSLGHPRLYQVRVWDTVAGCATVTRTIRE